MTTIVTKNGSGAPLASDLVQGELAVDLTNKRLYTEDSGGTVIELGSNPTSLTTGTFTSTGIDDNATSTAITIDASENVGIGTASPSAGAAGGKVLHVQNSGATASVRVDRSDAATAGTLSITSGNTSNGIYCTGAKDLSISTNSTERMRVDSSGNVGIGTTSPSELLHLKTEGTQLLIEDTSSGNKGSFFVANTTTVISSDPDNAVASSILQFQVDGSERMRIDSSGNVGIGTTSPTTGLPGGGLKVEKAYNGDAGAYIYNSGTGTAARSTLRVGGSNSEIYLYACDSAYTGVTSWADAGVLTTPSSNSGGLVLNAQVGNMKFQTATTERMRIDSSGNVGIGTSSPATKLHVAASGTPVIRIEDLDTARYSSIYTDNNGSLHFVSDGGSTTSSDVFTFNQGGSERMRIDSSGNLLVGTTTSIGSSTNTADNFTFSPSSGYAWIAVSDSGGVYIQRQNDGNVLTFYRATANAGSISIDAVAPTTNYNTTSDQRLKENIIDAPAGNIDAIRVRSFDWKESGAHQNYGMIAQELVAVAPEAVTQGGTEEDMWSVDYSKLVPMMIKEIQDLRARVAQLEGA